MRKKHEKEIRERNMTTDLDTGGDESPTIQFPYWPLIRTISNLLKLVNKASLNSSASHFQVVFHSKRMKRSAPEDLAQVTLSLCKLLSTEIHSKLVKLQLCVNEETTAYIIPKHFLLMQTNVYELLDKEITASPSQIKTVMLSPGNGTCMKTYKGQQLMLLMCQRHGERSRQLAHYRSAPAGWDQSTRRWVGSRNSWWRGFLLTGRWWGCRKHRSPGKHGNDASNKKKVRICTDADKLNILKKTDLESCLLEEMAELGGYVLETLLLPVYLIDTNRHTWKENKKSDTSVSWSLLTVKEK